MARPVGADPAKTRRRLLRAATALFTQRGRDGASMRAIARQAKVSLATVHHHFGSKERLYQACVDGMYATFDDLREELQEEAAAGTLAPDELVEAFVRRSFRFACAHREAVRLTTRHAIDAGEIDPERQAMLLLPGVDQAVVLLATLTGRPELELRLVVRSISYLIVRYAVTGRAELAQVLGLERDTPQARLERLVEDHLVRLARVSLGLPPPGASS
jgi:TetR/AcrR family transcriptional regulator